MSGRPSCTPCRRRLRHSRQYGDAFQQGGFAGAILADDDRDRPVETQFEIIAQQGQAERIGLAVGNRDGSSQIRLRYGAGRLIGRFRLEAIGADPRKQGTFATYIPQARNPRSNPTARPPMPSHLHPLPQRHPRRAAGRLRLRRPPPPIVPAYHRHQQARRRGRAGLAVWRRKLGAAAAMAMPEAGQCQRRTPARGPLA